MARESEFQRQVYDLATNFLKLGVIEYCDPPVPDERGYYAPTKPHIGRLIRDYNSSNTILRCLTEMIHHAIGDFDIIAAVSLSGTSPATSLRDYFHKDLIIVRTRPKYSGNPIEGLVPGERLDKKKVLVVDDRLESGQGTALAVQNVRDLGGIVEHTVCIYDNELSISEQIFACKAPFNNGQRLERPVSSHYVLSHRKMVDVAAREAPYINADLVPFLGERLKVIEEWRADPFNWGIKNGFPRIVR
jgi:orotate phosphoribosyltransferase